MKNRIPWGKEPFIKEEKLSGEQFEENYGTCHDCGAKLGEIHEYGCDMEECPVCHSQFMGCGEKCLNKIKNNKKLLIQCRNNSERKEKLDAYLPSLDYIASMIDDSKCEDEYVKPFFSCDPYCVKKSQKEGKYILPGGEYCL